MRHKAFVLLLASILILAACGDRIPEPEEKLDGGVLSDAEVDSEKVQAVKPLVSMEEKVDSEQQPEQKEENNSN